MADEKPAKEEVKPESANAAPAADAAKVEAPPAGPRLRLDMGVVAVVAAALVVTVGAPLATYLVIKSAAPAPVEIKHKPEGAGETVLPLKAVVVNIALTKGTRVLKLEPHLVLSDATLAEEIRLRSGPLMIDRVIQVASRKTLDELEGPQAREKFKQDLRRELNAAIKDKMSGSVVDVYFNEFLIQ